jgi:hypothetical protein
MKFTSFFSPFRAWTLPSQESGSEFYEAAMMFRNRLCGAASIVQRETSWLTIAGSQMFGLYSIIRARVPGPLRLRKAATSV